MQSGGELSIHCYQNNKWHVIEVKDNGEGIAKKDLSQVTEPFFSTKNRKQNFGLGLAYCSNCMQKHGGSLEIFSEKGSGTTVFLNFPIQNNYLKNLIPNPNNKI